MKPVLFRAFIFFLCIGILVGGWFFAEKYFLQKKQEAPAAKVSSNTSPSSSLPARSIPATGPDTQPTSRDTIATYPLIIGTTTLAVELADTPDLQEQGLSGRLSMPMDRGMLFPYRAAGRYAFWMKDMHFPLDFIWIDESGRVADTAHDVSPDTFPQAFRPAVPVPYVLEVNAGFIKKYGIAVGMLVDFSHIPSLK